VNTMLAGMSGSFAAMLYMWVRYNKPDASMSGNGLLAGSSPSRASGFVESRGSVIIRADCPACWVCISVEFETAF